MTAQSKAWVCDRLLAGIVGSRHGCLSLVSVMYCQVEVSAPGRSLVQRSSVKCGVSEFDDESSIQRRACPSGAVGHW